MASTSRNRQNSTTNEQQQHSKKQNVKESSHSLRRVKLNPADCDLAFEIEADGLIGYAPYMLEFAHLRSGARGDIGITGGKYCFGCNIIFELPVTRENIPVDDIPVDQQHICRIGISRGDDLVGNLGETEHSFGCGGTGELSIAGNFVPYGETFGVGDTIGCLVDLESKPFASLKFSKNGKRLGVVCFYAGTHGLGVMDSPARKLPWETALFPHVLLKNTVVKMQFSIEDGLVPEEGYRPWDSAVKDGKAVVGPGFADPKHLEVIMMVGLPACGKTTWAEKWAKGHPEKRYMLLGTDLLPLCQTKVPGLMQNISYREHLGHLRNQASVFYHILFTRASNLHRNYIIDHPNVGKSSRMHKLKPFFAFHKIAVVIFPRLEELRVRAEKRAKESGKPVSGKTVKELLAIFVLPMNKYMHGTDEYFDEVIFTDLNRDEAQQHLDEMKRVLKSSMVKSYNDHPNSRILPYFLPGTRNLFSGYTRPLLGTQIGTAESWVARLSSLQSNTVYRGDAEFGQHGALESVQQQDIGNTRSEGILEPSAGSNLGSLNPMLPINGYSGTLSRDSNPVPVEDRGHSSYRDPVPGNNSAQHRTPGNGSDTESAESVYQPPESPDASPDWTRNPRPQKGHPTGVWRPKTAWHPTTGELRPKRH